MPKKNLSESLTQMLTPPIGPGPTCGQLALSLQPTGLAINLSENRPVMIYLNKISLQSFGRQRSENSLALTLNMSVCWMCWKKFKYHNKYQSNYMKSKHTSRWLNSKSYA